MEQQCNDIDRRKPNNSKRNLSQCHFVHKNSTQTALVANPSLCDEMVINYLHYITALQIYTGEHHH
jgi:hypothetical protein